MFPYPLYFLRKNDQAAALDHRFGDTYSLEER